MKLDWRHYAILGAGFSIFVLLFLADKTNLKADTGINDTGENQQEGQAEPHESGDLLSDLHDASYTVYEDSLLAVIANSPIIESEGAYKQLVGALNERGRMDIAAVYAGRLADSIGSVKNLVVAGALFRNAALQETVAEEQKVFDAFFDQAIRHLGKAAEMDGKNEEVLIELGLSYIQSGRQENSMQGIQTLVKVTEINPENAEAAYHLGVFSLQTGQLEKAEKRFETVMRIQPGNLPAKLLLADTKAQLGKEDEANRMYGELTSQSEDPQVAVEAEKRLK